MARRSNDAAASARAGVRAAIAERAYFKAMERGFAPGHELDDWLAAEREVAVLMRPKAKRATVRRKPSAANQSN